MDLGLGRAICSLAKDSGCWISDACIPDHDEGYHQLPPPKPIGIGPVSVGLVPLVGLVEIVGQVSLVGLIELVGLVRQVGLVGLV